MALQPRRQCPYGRCLPEGSLTIVGGTPPSSLCLGSLGRLSATITVEAGEILSHRYSGCPLMYKRAVPFNFIRRHRLIPTDAVKPQFVSRARGVARWII